MREPAWAAAPTLPAQQPVQARAWVLPSPPGWQLAPWEPEWGGGRPRPGLRQVQLEPA